VVRAHGLLILALAASAHAQEPVDAPLQTLAPVVVSATRSAQSSEDLPLSIDRIGQREIRQGNAMVNLSESLLRVPGIVVQNRQNYAQDLQLSSRGFGARSTFGVRGVRLYVDGIPATMPDGQGQTSNIDLTSADHIEVLRGPFSALYGNSSGGVISVFTENGKPGTQLTPFAQFGSDGMRHYGLKAAGQQGTVNYLLSASRFATDGYRRHSAATRDTGNAKLRITPDEYSSLTLIGNAVEMDGVQDPLGLTRAAMEADPRGVAQNAISFNTRKSVRQQQLGLQYERIVSGADTLNATVYGGQRATTQFLPIPPSAQAAPTSAGGMIDLARRYAGIDLRWTHKTHWHGGPLQWSAGVSFDNLDEDRQGFENFSGAALGVQGQLRRDEANRAWNIDQYLQAQWEPGKRWLLLAGVRNSSVHVRTDDHYVAPGNGDDSGSTRYHALTPVLGATFRLTPALNLYASYGKGFETPTLNELSYRLSGAGFNFALRPARSNNIEAGIKAVLRPHWHANLALFRTETEDEITVLSNTGGRAVYQNAGKTRRTGVELALQGSWDNGLGALFSWSQLRAIYSDGFCNGSCSPDTEVRSGNRIPGVPDRSAYAELAWRHPSNGFSAALEGQYVGKVYVDDSNSDAAGGHFIANLRAGLEQKAGRWRLREFARIDNLAGRRYAGSVIVNEGNQRFFEPAPERNYLIGVSATHSW
jgi:iron complex outermembrane recepter protein